MQDLKNDSRINQEYKDVLKVTIERETSKLNGPQFEAFLKGFKLASNVYAQVNPLGSHEVAMALLAAIAVMEEM